MFPSRPSTDSDRLRHIARHIPGVIYEFVQYPDGRMAFPYASEGLVDLYGLSPESIQDDAGPMLAAVHPDDLADLMQAVQDSATHLTAWHCEHRIYHADGHLRWVQGDASPRPSPDGSIHWYGYVRDITEQKTSQLALQTSEHKLRQVIDTINGLVFMIAPDLTLSFLNDKVTKVTGYALDELLHRPFADVTHPDDLAHCVEALQACLQGEGCQNLEFRALHQDGHYHWYSTNLSPFVPEVGAATCCLGIATHIDDRKQVELALQASDARFQQLTAASPAVIYSVVESESGIVRFDYISPAVEEVDEISVAAAMQNGALLSAQVHPEDRERYLATYRASLQAMTTFRCEWRIITSSGRTKWLQASSRPERRPNGEVVWHGIVLETTAQKQAELELANLQAALLEAQEIAHIGNWSFDLASQAITWSPELFRMFGLDPAAGAPTYDAYLMMIHPDDRPLVVQAIEQAVSQGTPYQIDYRALLPNGEIRYHEGRGKIGRDEMGQITRLFGTCLDITDRKQTELTLRDNQLRLELALQSSSTGTWDWNMQTNEIVYSQNPWKEIAGYGADETADNTLAEWANRIHPEDQAQLDADIAKHVQGETAIYTNEHRLRCQDGTYRWSLAQGKVVEGDEAGQPLRFIGLYQDITDRKNSEISLADLREKLEKAQEIAHLGYWSFDLATQKITWSDEIFRIFGMAPDQDEPTFNEHLEQIHPDDRSCFLERVTEANQGIPQNFDMRILRPDGEVRHINSRLEFEYQGERIVRMFGVVIDITDRKRVEHIIRQQAARETLLREVSQRIRQSLDLSTIFTTACQEIRRCLHADRVGIFKFYSESGYDEGEFVAEACVDGLASVLATPVHDHCFGTNYANLYRQGHYLVINDTDKANLADCHANLLAQFQVRASLVLPLLCGDRLWGLLCIHQCCGPRQWLSSDIDLGQQLANQLAIALQQSILFEQLQRELQERQRAQQQLSDRNQELAIANQDLSRATRIKDEFLANMSHELRTPLNVILGFAQILNADSSLQAQQREYIRIMQRSGDHLLHLINDILDLSKIEANCITLEPESIDLFSLLRDLQAMFQERAEDNDLTFTLALSPDLPQYIVADPNKLRQVLINLLGNAVKFTEVGGIALRVSLHSPEEIAPESAIDQPSAYLAFAVEDTGTGIDPSDLAAIFDAFTQAKAGRVSLEGTGLGLAISRSLVHLMAGKLTVNSTLGEGSTFRFTLPLRLAQAEDVTSTDNLGTVIGLAPGQPTYRILVADDQPENRYLLVASLSRLGLAVQEATNGAEAIARWRQWHPHLIWMDLRMPEMDGYEATRCIRAEAQKHGEGLGPVIIALTAQASRDQRYQALGAGCDDVVSKPIQLNLLLAKMADHLGLRYRYAQAVAQQTQDLPPKSLSNRLEASALQVMSADWISALHRAAMLCDSHEVAQLVQQIPPEHKALIDTLDLLLQDFKFEVLMQLTLPSDRQ